MATDLEQLTLRIEANTRGIDRALKTLNKNLDGQFKAMENRASAFEKHLSAVGRSAMGVFASLGAGLGAAQLAQDLTATALQMDRVNKALTVATGSRAAARAEFEFVRTTANALGLELMSTAQQYAFLAAAAKGTALEGQAIRDIFTGVATASSSLGLSAANTAGVLNSVQQMISKGVVSAEEMRQQFGERLPGGMAAAERAMGMTNEEFAKALESGQILSTDLLPKLAVELMKMGDAAGAGLQAEINRLNNAWTELQIAFADTGAIKVAISGLKSLTSALQAFNQGYSRGFLDDIFAGLSGGGITGYARALAGVAGTVGMEPAKGAGRTVGYLEDGFKPKAAAPSRRSGGSGSRSRSGGGSSRGALGEAQRMAEATDQALRSAEDRAMQLAGDWTDQKLENAFIVNQQVWDEQEAAALRVRDAYEQLGDMAAGALDDIIVKGEDAGRVIGQLLLKLAEMIAIQSISGEGAFAGVFGDIFGRASGGPVRRGRPYLVGENGPELMIPSGPGQIVPRGQLGGGGMVINLNSTVNAPGANPSTLALMNQMLAARDAQMRRDLPALISNHQRRNQLGGQFR